MIDKSLVNTWYDKLKSGDKKEADDYYYKEIFPRIIEKFVRENNRFRGKYENLISLVGMSPEPIILTLKALEPKKVLFLYSQESELYLELIHKYYPLPAFNVVNQQIDASRVESIYEKIKDYMRNKDCQATAVDISGGKKAMASGASAAASFLGCDIFYVDYSDYNPYFRKPEPGTEFLNRLKNPVDVFGDFKRREGIELFNSGAYEGAKQVFAELQRKAIHKELYDIYMQILIFYENWENYNFESAIKHGRKALELIDQFRKCESYLDTLEEQLEILRRLKDQQKPWLVCNHFFMSKRFQQRNRLQFAALLLYRTLEMAMTFRLQEKYQIEADRPNYSAFPELGEKYMQNSVTITQNKRKNNRLPDKIGFVAAAILLCALEDELVDVETAKRLYPLTEVRNKSVLAHGTESINEKQYQKMLNAFTGLFKRFIDLYLDDFDFNQLEDLFQPIKLAD